MGVNENGRFDETGMRLDGRDEYDEGYTEDEVDDDLDLDDLDEDDDDESGLLPSERRQNFVDPGVEDEELDEDEAEEAARLERELLQGVDPEEEDEALGRAGPDE